MTDAPEDTHLKTIWQDQPTESQAMSLDAIHHRARRFQSKIFWGNIVIYVQYTFTVLLFSAVIVATSDPVTKACVLLSIFGVLFVLYYNHRHGQSNRAAVATASEACLSFHKQALVQRIHYCRTIWAWCLLPIIPGPFLLIAHAYQLRGAVTSLNVLTVFTVAGLIGTHIYGLWRARRMEKELRSLESLNG